MSLQVWLPLNGDLHNQGLGQITSTSGTPSYKANGKIGGNALDLKTRITFVCPQLANLQTFSVCFWGLAGSSSTLTTNWQDLLGFTDVSSGGTTGTFRWETTYASTNGIHWHDNVTNAFVNGSHTHISVKDVWCHCCVVFDYNAGKLYTYTNGVLVNTHNHLGGKFNTTGTFYLGETNNIEGMIQDVRFYDHALSNKEVEEIAKGLVLHYPLNNNGLGGDNQLKNSNFSNGTTSWYGVNSSSIKVETKDNYICGTGTKGTSNNIIGQTSMAYTGGTYINITVSAKIYVEEAGTIGVGHWITTTQASGWQSMSGTRVWNTSQTLSIGWNYISTTLKNATNQYTGSIVTAFSYTGSTFWITNVKLEEGSIATPWSPAKSELGDMATTVYDCSGYSNNGTIVGSLTAAAPSPRYDVCTHIPATSSKIHISNLTTSGFGNSYSFAWWGRRDSNSPMFWGFSDGIRLNGMYTGVLWNTGDGSNNPLYNIGTTTQATAPSTNIWHHYVMTGNGSKCYVYLDGELWAEAKTYKAISGTSIYINGWDSGTQYYCSNNTDISDFRIYATALTADQVKELYNTLMSIDSSGNVYARQLNDL